MKELQEKSEIYNIQDKTSTPPKPKAKQKLPLKSSQKDDTHQVQNSRGQQTKHMVSQWQKITLPLKPRLIMTSVKLNQRRQLPLK
jgi:hypothetical protein